jgi:hypothetical protein
MLYQFDAIRPEGPDSNCFFCFVCFSMPLFDCFWSFGETVGYIGQSRPSVGRLEFHLGNYVALFESSVPMHSFPHSNVELAVRPPIGVRSANSGVRNVPLLRVRGGQQCPSTTGRPMESGIRGQDHHTESI